MMVRDSGLLFWATLYTCIFFMPPSHYTYNSAIVCCLLQYEWLCKVEINENIMVSIRNV